MTCDGARDKPPQEDAGPVGKVQGSPRTSDESPGSTADAEKGGTPVRLVERKTELRCLSIGRPRPKKSAIRKNTEEDLRGLGPEIPYVRAEQAQRDLVCSLMERQDRMNEELLERVIDLQYRMDELEAGRGLR